MRLQSFVFLPSCPGLDYTTADLRKLVRFRDLALLWRFVFRDVVCTLCETLLINTLVVAIVFYNLRCAAPLLVEESVPLSIHSLLRQTVFVP